MATAPVPKLVFGHYTIAVLVEALEAFADLGAQIRLGGGLIGIVVVAVSVALPAVLLVRDELCARQRSVFVRIDLREEVLEGTTRFALFDAAVFVGVELSDALLELCFVRNARSWRPAFLVE